jgi:trimethylamine--corrinoid protein Co-methyltransferase
VPFVGDNLSSKAISPAIVVYANEVIAQARRFAQGFALDAAAVGLDEIAAIGPGGNFLMSDTTLKNFRTAYYRSDIFPTLTLEEWQARGCPRAVDLLRSYTSRQLEQSRAPEDGAELLARGEAYIQALAARRP